MAESSIAQGPTLAAPPARPGDRLADGTRIADYTIERFLGAGAMGEVYAALHPVIDKRVAIKVLRRELAEDEEAAERFMREARAANRVEHPNVVEVFNFGRLDDGRLFFVMELVAGRSLREVLAGGPLPIEQALDILDAVAGAVDAAHARGVVHRDLKPDNVMLSDGTPPRIYVLDFGVAKLLADGAKATATLTARGTWLGTPGYMAPEQWSSDGAGPASDRYALGVMAYELLAGALPFQASTLPQMMEQHFRAPVPSLATRSAAGRARILDRALDRVLARALAKNPDERFATARELVAALREAAGGKRPPARHAGRALPAAIGAGVLGVAIVGYALLPDEPSEPVAARGLDAGAPAIDDRLARLVVETVPPGATVSRAGELLGRTPFTLREPTGTEVALVIAKPGYRTITETITARSTTLHRPLEAITRFEGVWMMPDGQLRGFTRVGERVDVAKHATATGAGTPWRRFDLVAPPADRPELVVFQTEAELSSDPHPSCQIKHLLEYRYDPATDQLEARAERVQLGRRDGVCFERDRQPGEPIALRRADRGVDDVVWTQPPMGKLDLKRPTQKPAPRPAPKPAPKPVRQANQNKDAVDVPAQSASGNEPAQANEPPPQVQQQTKQ